MKKQLQIGDFIRIRNTFNDFLLEVVRVTKHQAVAIPLNPKLIFETKFYLTVGDNNMCFQKGKEKWSTTTYTLIFQNFPNMSSIEKQLQAIEVNKINPLALHPLIEFAAKKEIKIDEMVRGGEIPYPKVIKDGERIICRVDGTAENGKYQSHGITLLNGNTAMISTEHFHQVEFKQFSNRYKLLAQFHN